MVEMQVTLPEIEQLKRQNKKVQHRVFYRLYGPLLSACRRYTPQSGLAEDAVSIAFIRGYGQIRLFQFNHELSFYAWLKTIAIREVLYELRKDRLVLRTDYAELESIEAEAEILDEIPIEVNYILQKLELIPVSQKTVFLLFVAEGYSHEEIAEMLGIAISNSKVLLHRAKVKMQKLVKLDQKKGASQ